MWWLNQIDQDKLVTLANRSDILFWQHHLNSPENKAFLSKVFVTKPERHYGADLFNVLWRVHPTLKPRAEVEDKIFRAWLNKVIQSDPFNKLRDKTMGNKEISASATARLYKQFVSTRKNTSSQLDTIKKLNEAIRDAEDNENDEVKEALDEALNNMEQIIESETEKQENMEEISKALEKTDEEIEDMILLASILSTQKGGQGQSEHDSRDSIAANLLGMEKVIATLKKKDFKKILDYAGRMVAILENKRKTGVQRSAVPMDITQGKDLPNVLSAEFALLADPDTEDLFAHKLVTETLLQYRKKTKQAEGRGPIVFCCDYSGSMYGEPLNMAMALLVVMSREAIKESRSLAFIPFADYAQKPPVMIHNAIDLANAIANNYSVGGGTNFEKPLSAARTTIQTNKQMEKADIVFISDGICSLNSSFIKQFIEDKTANNWKLLGVSIQTKFWPDQLPMFDGIMHMDRYGKLDWFTDFSKHYLDR